MKQELNGVIIVVLWVILGLSGCDKNDDQASRIDWSETDIVVVGVEQVVERELGILYFVLRGSVIQEFARLLEEKTGPHSADTGGLQLLGGDTLVYAMDKNGDPTDYFCITVQWVEGIGGKWDRWDHQLLKSQSEKCQSVHEMVRAKGEQIPQKEAESYVQKFEHFPRDSKYTRYWKK